MQSCAIAEKYKSFLDSEDGGWWVGTLVGPGAGRKYTNTRLMTLSQSTCFVTSEGGLFKRITAEIHKYNIIEEYSNAL